MSAIRRQLSALTLDELRTVARKLNIPKYREFSKADLVEQILCLTKKEIRTALGQRSWFKDNLVGILGIILTIALGIPGVWIVFAGESNESQLPPNLLSPPELTKEAKDTEDAESWLEKHYLTPSQNPFIWLTLFGVLIWVSPNVFELSKDFALSQTGAALIAKIVPKRYIIEGNAREVLSAFRYGSEQVYLGRWTKDAGWTGSVHELPRRHGRLWRVTIFDRGESFSSAMIWAYTSAHEAADLRNGDIVRVNGKVWKIDGLCINLRPCTITKIEENA